ncbi:hypothetical protein FXF53_22315 [Micromonospora sp. WP24]|nr:hypothetical protein FXF53_22315 [Micromonospora sp. WP24]
MDSWAGAFKNNLIDHFVTSLQNTLPNERELARLTRKQLKCTEVIYIRFRQSVLGLLENGVEATKALSQSACSSDDLFKWGGSAAPVGDRCSHAA